MTTETIAPVAAKSSFVTRARRRIAGVLVTIAFLIGLPISAANATTPVVPDAGDAVNQAASDLGNGLVDGFVGVLPYVIPVLVLFTVLGYVWRMFATRKSAR